MAIEDVIPYNPNQNKFGRASPILVFGILLLTLSFFDDAFNFKLPGIVRIGAIIIIIIGIIHSAMKQLN